jgi:hypothetical protein
MDCDPGDPDGTFEYAVMSEADTPNAHSVSLTPLSRLHCFACAAARTLCPAPVQRSKMRVSG